MTFSSRTKVGCLFTLVALFCIGIGFVAGVIAHQTWKKKTDEPGVMKWMVLKRLEKLEPTSEQLKRIEPKVDAALADLAIVKAEATESVWQIIDRATDSIADDLTPEQQERWRTIRPKRPN